MKIENCKFQIESQTRPGLRVALVHDWLTGMRGGEKCLEVLCRLWPDARLYTLIHRSGSVSPAIERMDVRTSFLQRVPGIFRHYRYFLPLMPAAIESFRITDVDLVISLSHCVAKSLRVPPGVPHICYCFTPMRYAWHMREAYWSERGARRAEGPTSTWIDVVRPALGSPFSALSSTLRSVLLCDLRRWDRATAGRVTRFVAISRTVEKRIRECYDRSSDVIYPPVDSDFFAPSDEPRDEFYLCVSALAPYKRLDLAVAACSRLGRRLVVIGSGPADQRLRAAAGPTVRFLGWQSDKCIREHYRRCRALLFPGKEDFGIVPLEAQACGTPVIALAAGGATETVLPAASGVPGTGLFFDDQTTDSLMAAIERFESGNETVSPALARENAERFCKPRFTEQIQAFVAGVLRGEQQIEAGGAGESERGGRAAA